MGSSADENGVGMVEGETSAETIAANTEPAQRDNDELFAKALELAPRFDTLANVARAVNDALDIDMTAGAWRGLFVRNPEQRERIRKKLGTEKRKASKIARVDGDVRGIVFSDVHAPFHDKNAIALAAKVAKWWQPDVAIYNGDDHDFYKLSRFSQNPERTECIQDEIDIWHIEVMAPLQAALPSKRKEYLVLGNHGRRLLLHLWAHPQLYGIRALEIPALLELERLGIEYAETKVLFGDLLEVSHGTRVRSMAGYSAKAESEKRRYSISTITGHVHRAGRFTTRTARGWIYNQEAPCLCQLTPEYADDPDWVDWVQGVTLFEIRGRNLRIDAVEFYPDYTCMVGKQTFGL